MTTQIRAAVPADAEACGRIMYEAFAAVAHRHGFEPDFPSAEAAIGLAAALTRSGTTYGVVAERDGRIIGSNFLKESDSVRGVGPITVAPGFQGDGTGRRLMQAVIERGNGADSVRLLQDGFNMGSLGLYASLGFAVREPVVVMAGTPDGKAKGDVEVRPLLEEDIDACDALCKRVHGFSRRSELVDAVRDLAPMVAVREGRVVAYATEPLRWIISHAVAATTDDMEELLLGAARLAGAPLSFLLPTRQEKLFRRCLALGLRATKPMTLMTRGRYDTPAGVYMPSVFY
ncbi:GNAT family N-acetyltransferase [Nitratireductor mangrovi]|uniref:GNAT family N-acetyltransferase n=1 Tax=Nitratireductor mangrovi TaxID=2599600 RepID=A0A5B8KTH7_9HYPH|nr:GNAT family N-acetyltransferase [Nitratireductor mangrovi]QDY98906.1 GNAT family N-acetyltransferase [Nitratireductor mangrovi]